ncbi:MAG: Protein translocase membrane subunit SecG, partial [uncultured Gemmatimonadaceae bacterium]
DLHAPARRARHREPRAHRRRPAPEREGGRRRRVVRRGEFVRRRVHRAAAGGEPAHEDQLVGGRDLPLPRVRAADHVHARERGPRVGARPALAPAGGAGSGDEGRRGGTGGAARARHEGRRACGAEGCRAGRPRGADATGTEAV